MTTELDNYQFWQLENKGNILPTPEMEIEEPGEDEARRFAEWSHLQWERELHEHDYQWTNERL